MSKKHTPWLDDILFPTKSGKRGERRKQNIKKALRKKEICREVYDHEWYDNLHEYSKNKIHCSCPMCSGMNKTNSKRVNRGGAKTQSKLIGFGTTNHRNGKNWPVSDLRKIESGKTDTENTIIV